MNGCIYRLLRFYNQAQPGSAFHSLARQLLGHLWDAPHCSIEQLAELCFSSVSSLSRFVRALDYSSFSQFRTQLSADLAAFPSSNWSQRYRQVDTADVRIAGHYWQQLTELLTSCRAHFSFPLLEQAADAFFSASRILFCLDTGLTPACLRFQTDLFLSGKSAALADPAQAGSLLEKGGLVFAAPDGTAADAVLYQLFDRAQATGVKVISVTPFLNVRRKRSTDILLSYDSALSPMDRYAPDFALDIISSIYRVKYMAEL